MAYSYARSRFSTKGLKCDKVRNKVHVSADAMFSVSQNTKFVDVLDATEIRDLMKKVYGEESAALSLLSNGNTDWQREIYQSALTGDANAAVSGKVGDISNYMPYRVSIGYHNQTGTLKTSKMERATAGVNLTPTLFKEHLKVDFLTLSMRHPFCNNQSLVSMR